MSSCLHRKIKDENEFLTGYISHTAVWVCWWIVYVESSGTEDQCRWDILSTARSNISIWLPVICSLWFSCWIWRCITNGVSGATTRACIAACHNSVSTYPGEAQPLGFKMSIVFWVARKGRWCKLHVAPRIRDVLISITGTCIETAKQTACQWLKKSGVLLWICSEHHPYPEEKHNVRWWRVILERTETNKEWRW